MEPHRAFCDNPDCPARGQTGRGNIKVHSHKEQRFRCTTCGKTFAASTGTPFYRLHKARSLLVLVVTLLAHGCPPQAIVAAFGLGERTVADRYAKAGRHAHDVHHHFLGTRPLGGVTRRHSQRRRASGFTVGCLFSSPRSFFDGLAQ